MDIKISKKKTYQNSNTGNKITKRITGFKRSKLDRQTILASLSIVINGQPQFQKEESRLVRMQCVSLANCFNRFLLSCYVSSFLVLLEEVEYWLITFLEKNIQGDFAHFICIYGYQNSLYRIG